MDFLWPVATGVVTTMGISEVAWQLAKVLMGLIVILAVVVWDMKPGERDIGSVMIAGGLAMAIGGIIPLLDYTSAGAWCSRISLMIMVLSVIKMLRATCEVRALLYERKGPA